MTRARRAARDRRRARTLSWFTATLGSPAEKIDFQAPSFDAAEGEAQTRWAGRVIYVMRRPLTRGGQDDA